MNNIENELLIIRGLPGSGKSTLANSLADDIGAIVVEADMYFLNEGKYSFDSTKLKEAHKWCQQTAKAYTESGLQAIISNTFIKIWEMNFYIDLGIKHDGTIIIECTKQFDSIHNVPENIIEHMETRFEKEEYIEQNIRYIYY